MLRLESQRRISSLKEKRTTNYFPLFHYSLRMLVRTAETMTRVGTPSGMSGEYTSGLITNTSSQLPRNKLVTLTFNLSNDTLKT